MDPKANLKEQSKVAQQIMEIWDNCDDDGSITMNQTDELAGLSHRLAELVLAKQEWDQRQQVAIIW